jgi:hypothetical protein
MTDSDSPSSLLGRAAEHLEELAKHFEHYRQNMGDEAVRWWAYDAVDRGASRSARQWVETLSPAVAQPLVEWLRAVASYVGDGNRLNDADRAALRFARQVLGES